MLDNYVKRSMYGAAKSGAGTDRHNITPRSTYFGLADLGFGCPEMGYFSLSEIASVRLPYGLRIERDLHFSGHFGLTVYADAARIAGQITENECLLASAARAQELTRTTEILPGPGE